MIVVILKNPPARVGTNFNVELRVMIEGMTLEEADDLGQAIYEFARKMKRSATMTGFQIEPDEALH
jgi:hypothetical protein